MQYAQVYSKYHTHQINMMKYQIQNFEIESKMQLDSMAQDDP